MNGSIDFHLIRNNKNESFEILSKMLFEKCFKVGESYCFHQLDGRSGDGGVEGYFSDPQGNRPILSHRGCPASRVPIYMLH